MRKLTSLVAFISFVLELITSVILYIIPQSRIAYWADWHLWGLDKSQWGNLHINLGILFFVALLLHILFNLKPMMSYLKNRHRQFKLFTAAFNTAFFVTALVVVGTLFEVPPFSTVIDFSGSIKDEAALFYGEPPYGHAELSSLATFSSKMKIDPVAGMESLKRVGLRVESDQQTLLEIAKNNSIAPQKIYQIIKPVEKMGQKKMLPDDPPTGFGRHSIALICQEYELNVAVVLKNLAEQGYTTSGEKTLKEASGEYGIDPFSFYDIFKMAAVKG